jgi:hypothetical protein
MSIFDRVPRLMRASTAQSLVESAVKKATTESSEAWQAEIATQQATFKKEISRLEGLLDVAGLNDPDSNIPDQPHALFRSLAGGGDADKHGARDLPSLKLTEMRKLSHLTFALRGDAQNIVSIHVDFALGDDGLRPIAAKLESGEKNDELQAELDEIWFDDRNRLALRQGEMAEALYLDGERFGICELNTADGSLEMGWLAPELVERVEQDQLGRDLYVHVQNRDSAGGELLRYFVLDSYVEGMRIERIGDEDNARYLVSVEQLDSEGRQKTGSEKVHGLMFAMFEGRPEGATRGRPLLAPVLDYIDIHDELLWVSLEREKLLKQLLIDVSGEGISNPEEARTKLKELGLLSPPTGPTVKAHGKDIEIEYKAPPNTQETTEELERILRVNIYGAFGFPEHWSGSGADANLATAQAQEALPLRRLRRRQRKLREAFHRVVEVSLQLRRQQGSITKEIGDFEMQVTEIGGRDKARGTEVVKRLVESVLAAVSEKLIQRELANALVLEVLRDAGFEVPDDFAALPEQDSLEDPIKRMARVMSLIDEQRDETDDPAARGAGTEEDAA